MKKIKKINNKCYVCSSNSLFFLKNVNNFNLVSCVNCEIIYVPKNQITSEQLKNFYSENYYHNNSVSGYDNYLALEKVHYKNSKSLLDILPSVDKKNANYLDIGSAFGFLLDAAKGRGYKTSGVEMSKYSRDYARKRFGLLVFPSVNNLLKNKKNFYDVISLIGTIEHLRDPENMLRKINHLLKPGGLLMITTIDTKGYFPLYSLKPPEHLFYFSKKNLELLLKKQGFVKVKAKTYFAHYLINDLFHRLAVFFNLSILKLFSNFFGKRFPNLSIKIPTNEIIFLCKKS